jgi:cytochrome c-type biogenesis protein CcmH
MRAVVTALLLAVVMGGVARAGPSQVATDVAQDVMSPFCPGLTLHDCPSRAADRLRDRIQRWAGNGLNRAEILGRLRREYGQGILASPPRSGAGLVAWLLPAAAAVAGLGAAAFVVARWARRRPSVADSVRAPLRIEERARLDEELAALRESR